MAKVLSSGKGIGLTTKNVVNAKNRMTIGPGSTTGSRGSGATQKPSGNKTLPMTVFGPKTMSQKAPASRMTKSVSAHGPGAALVKPSGAMPKFGGKK